MKETKDYQDERIKTDWVKLGPFIIAKKPNQELYILPGCNVINYDQLQALADQNDWTLDEPKPRYKVV